MQAREVVVRYNERHFLGVVRVFVRAAHDTRIYQGPRHNDVCITKSKKMKDSGRVRNPSGRILALIETFISRQTTDVPIQSMAKIFDTRKYTRNICPICFYERPRKTTNSRGSTLRLLARASYLFLSSQNIRLRGCHYAILGNIILGKKIMMLLRKGTRSYRDYKFYGNL